MNWQETSFGNLPPFAAKEFESLCQSLERLAGEFPPSRESFGLCFAVYRDDWDLGENLQLIESCGVDSENPQPIVAVYLERSDSLDTGSAKLALKSARVAGELCQAVAFPALDVGETTDLTGLSRWCAMLHSMHLAGLLAGCERESLMAINSSSEDAAESFASLFRGKHQHVRRRGFTWRIDDFVTVSCRAMRILANLSVVDEPKLIEPLTENDRHILEAMLELDASMVKPEPALNICDVAASGKIDQKKAFTRLIANGLVDSKQRFGYWLTPFGKALAESIG